MTPNAKDLIRPAKRPWAGSQVRSPQDGLILLNVTAALRPSGYGDSIESSALCQWRRCR
jgi:hypothetical protein